VIDDRVHELVRAGDGIGATALIVETFGNEIYGYLITLLRDEDLASDAFAAACEDVLKAVVKFRGESSVRTWLYTVARHAGYREARAQRKRRGERLTGVADALQAPVRSITAAFRRTEVKASASLRPTRPS
jgi:RNA polymerase sigma factor (sigma-70 family)